MVDTAASESLRVAILDDVFRCIENGTGPHPDNLLWLDAVLAPAIRALGGSQVRVSSHDFAERRVDAGEAMAACGLTPGIGAWAQILEMDETSVIGPWLLGALAEIDVVVGFELPNVIFDALAGAGLTVVDLTFSPIRFLGDLCLDVRTNDPGLKTHLKAIAIPEDEVLAEVAQIAATVRRKFNGVRAAASLGAAGVLLGQTRVDASLIEAGQVVRLADYTDRILAWADPFDTVILKPHPYGARALDVPELRRSGKRVVRTATSPYQLFSYENVIGAAGISSGSLIEAGWFGVDANRFLTPPRERHGTRPVERVSSAVFTAPFWRAWRAGDAPLEGARRLPSLRAQVKHDWGYDTRYPNPKFRRVWGVFGF
ncbi:MAG: hypothetical protein QNJ16_09225 [Rhodobacter sp.]|nr:hypothetical protein [Rhodobacter sp.]